MRWRLKRVLQEFDMDRLELILKSDINDKQFYDFVVNGMSLYENIRASDRNPFSADFDFIGCFQPDLFISYVSELIDMFNLKTKSELVNSKIPIFVCPICADVDCGGKSVRVIETDTTFIWEKFEIFAFEEVEDCGENVIFDHCFYPTQIVKKYEFDKVEYNKALEVACG